MGKQAATKVQAGAEGTGARGRCSPSSRTQTGEFTEASEDPRGHARGGRHERLRRRIRAHGARSHRPLPAGLLRRLRRQGRLLPGGVRLRRGAAGSARACAAAAGGELAGQAARRPRRPARRARRRPGSGPRADRRGARGGPRGAGKTRRGDETGRRFHRFGARGASRGPNRRRRSPPRGSSPASTRSSTPGWRRARTGGFRELLPEFMYFAVLPYFGAEMADAEMRRRVKASSGWTGHRNTALR